MHTVQYCLYLCHITVQGHDFYEWSLICPDASIFFVMFFILWAHFSLNHCKCAFYLICLIIQSMYGTQGTNILCCHPIFLFVHLGCDGLHALCVEASVLSQDFCFLRRITWPRCSGKLNVFFWCRGNRSHLVYVGTATICHVTETAFVATRTSLLSTQWKWATNLDPWLLWAPCKYNYGSV